jgi:hypothetical protein
MVGHSLVPSIEIDELELSESELISETPPARPEEDVPLLPIRENWNVKLGDVLLPILRQASIR